MPACVAEHVRVHVRESRPISGSLDYFGNVRAGHWAATLGGEHKGRLWLLIAREFTQCPEFVTLNRVHAINTVFESSNVQMGLGEIDLIPSEINGLGHPQAVTSHYEDQRGVTVPVAALASGLHELG
jgi:hypothetical protein